MGLLRLIALPLPGATGQAALFKQALSTLHTGSGAALVFNTPSMQQSVGEGN